MKTGILLGLCVALVANCASIRAADNPDQAAALAALNQKLYELNHPGTQPSADTNAATATAVPPAKSAINQTHASTTMTTPPATEVPTPARMTPVSTAPAGSDFAAKIPAGNASAQAAALAALNQKIEELNHPEAPRAADANSAPEMATTPLTETPAAEAPMAKMPPMVPAAVTPVSAAPTVAAPALKIATALAAAAPARIPPAAMLPFPFSSPGLARPTNELVTTSGKTYRNVEVERVVSDGIFISYIPTDGNWAMTKIRFKDLPPKIRREYDKRQIGE